LHGSFSQGFRDELADLMRWRRDVRRFRDSAVDEAMLERCLTAFSMAPSVGLSEPWRLIRVQSPASRAAMQANFATANAKALACQTSDRAAVYARLKLSGMAEAPVQFAVFCDDTTPKGAGLGAGTMPETRTYSVIAAITLFWLAARAEGLSVGWVSILDPAQVQRDLDVPPSWAFVAYLCVGWPEENQPLPELERLGWEARTPELIVENR
jgi:5,6-dimethylbenzimidazole synthase